MMSHSDVIKTQIPQNVFGLFDHAQLFRSHWFTVWNAGAQTGHLRFVRSRQAELGRKFTNFRLRESHFFERGAYLKIGSRHRPGTVIANVACIFTVSNHSKTLRLSQGSKL